MCLTWCGTSSSYPLVEPVAQQAMETMAELGRESRAERSCETEKSSSDLTHLSPGQITLLHVNTLTQTLSLLSVLHTETQRTQNRKETAARAECCHHLTLTHLYGTFIVMGYIQEHGVCNGWHQRAETGLNQRSNRLSSVPVHQASLLMAVTG